jgi:hypothetical protein
MQVTTVPSGHVTNVLPQVLPHLHRVAPRTEGRSTVDDILSGILAGSSTLWLAFDETQENRVFGVCLTIWQQYPRMKTLNVTYCAGDDLHLWRDLMMEKLVMYAKDSGCSKIEFTGRRGWLKALASWGVKEAYVVGEIDLGARHG